MHAITIALKALSQNGYGKDWEQADGPDSGVGVDFWLVKGDATAYVNEDQGHVTVSIGEDRIYEGDGSDLE